MMFQLWMIFVLICGRSDLIAYRLAPKVVFTELDELVKRQRVRLAGLGIHYRDA